MDKEALHTPHLPEAEVETHAGPIRVRGLSRAEVLRLQKLSATGDTDALDARTLELAVIEPKLSPDDVKKWRESWTHQDFEPIIEMISELSGMETEEEEREASFRPGSE